MPFASFSASKRLWELGGLYPVGAWKHLTPLGTYGNPSQGARTFRFIGDGELGDPTGQSRLGHVPLALRTVRALRIRPSPLHALTDWAPPAPDSVSSSVTLAERLFLYTLILSLLLTLYGAEATPASPGRTGDLRRGGHQVRPGQLPLDGTVCKAGGGGAGFSSRCRALGGWADEGNRSIPPPNTPHCRVARGRSDQSRLHRATKTEGGGRF